MALEGTIKEFGLADIFQLIGLQKKTGILFLKGPEETVNIHFEDGMVVKVDESRKRPKYMLGRILVNRGKINEAKLKEAIEIQKSTGQKLGGVLISQGLINKEELRDALSFQINEAVYKVFRWKGGDYKFDQERVDFDRDTIIPLSTEHILMDGIRMLDEWPKIEKNLPAPHVVLKRKPGGVSSDDGEDADIFTGMGKEGGRSRDEEHILKLFDGSKSILEVVEMSMLGEFDTHKTIVDLLEQGILATTDARPEIISQPVGIPEFKAPATSYYSILNKLPYIMVAVALAIIFYQLTGTREIMNPHVSRLENLKVPFATNTVKKLRNALSGYFLDFGDFPESVSSLEQLDYVGSADAVDPWGNTINIELDARGNYMVTSAGPDGNFGTNDDIKSAP